MVLRLTPNSVARRQTSGVYKLGQWRSPCLCDGQGRRRSARLTTEGHCYGPTFLRDGQSILYQRRTDDRTAGRIFVIDANGGSPQEFAWPGGVDAITCTVCVEASQCSAQVELSCSRASVLPARRKSFWTIRPQRMRKSSVPSARWHLPPLSRVPAAELREPELDDEVLPDFDETTPWSNDLASCDRRGRRETSADVSGKRARSMSFWGGVCIGVAAAMVGVGVNLEFKKLKSLEMHENSCFVPGCRQAQSSRYRNKAIPPRHPRVRRRQHRQSSQRGSAPNSLFPQEQERGIFIDMIL